MLTHSTAKAYHKERERTLRKAAERDSGGKARTDISGPIVACADFVSSIAKSVSIANRQASPTT